MAKIPADVLQGFRALLHKILNSEEARPDRAKERRDHLDALLGVLAANDVNLREALKTLDEAWHEHRRALDERRKIAEEDKRYRKQRRGQKLLAKSIPLLRKSLPPDDPHLPLVEKVHSTTLSDSSGSLSPPLGPIKLLHVGNPPMPWLANARERLREAGVTQEETREELLSILGLKRRQRQKQG